MSRTRCLAVLVFAMTLVSARADGRTYVVDQAGNGDFTTITAALRQGRFTNFTDTVVVHAGFYPETLNCDNFRSCLLESTAGPESTTVLRGGGAATRWKVRGLTVLDMPADGGGWIDWSNCRFRSSMTISGRGGYVSTFTDCDFFEAMALTILNEYQSAPFGCRFHRVPVRMDLSGSGYAYLGHCTFEGSNGDTLVWTDGYNSITFDHCAFSGGAIGVYAETGSAFWFKGCDFTNVGLGFDGQNQNSSSSEFNNYVTLDTCRFDGCGRVLRTVYAGYPGTTSGVLLRHSVISGFSGDAVAVTEAAPGTVHVSLVDDRFEHGGGKALALYASKIDMQGCSFFDNDGPAATLHFTTTGQVSTLQQNTLAFNTGDGLVITGTDDVVPQGLIVTHNIVAQNGGAGIRYASPYAGGLSYNDSWQNYGAEYVGVTPNATNVSLDPKFCDLVNGDLTLSAGSPFAPGSAFGRAGAYGVGCDTELLDAPPLADLVALAVRPNPARGAVTFALPGRASTGALEVLDVQGRRVWRAPIDAGAASLQWRGEREGGTRAGAGIYWVRVQRGATTTQTKRFIWLE